MPRGGPDAPAGVATGHTDHAVENIYGRHLCRELTQSEAGELLGVGERTFRRWSARFIEEGEDGLRGRRIGSAAPNRVPDAVSMQVEALYRERFDGFTAKHFHEHLARTAWLDRSYTWTKLITAAPRANRGRAPAWCAPPQASAPPVAGHDAAPGCEPSCVGSGRADVRFGCDVSARPVQAALASAATFSVGAAAPLVLLLLSPTALLFPVVAAGSLVFF